METPSTVNGKKMVWIWFFFKSVGDILFRFVCTFVWKGVCLPSFLFFLAKERGVLKSGTWDFSGVVVEWDWKGCEGGGGWWGKGGLCGCNSSCFFYCFFGGGIVEFAPLGFFFIYSFLVLRAFCCLFFLFFFLVGGKGRGGRRGGGWEYGFSFFFLALRGFWWHWLFWIFMVSVLYLITPFYFSFFFFFLFSAVSYRLPFFFPSSSFSLVSASFFAPTPPSRPNLSTPLFTFFPKILNLAVVGSFFYTFPASLVATSLGYDCNLRNKW